MNVFVCDRDPVKAAAALCDSRVIRMAEETAILLATVGVAIKRPVPNSQYVVIVEVHDAVVRSAITCPHYRTWVWQYAAAVSDEHVFRFGTLHRHAGFIREAKVILDSGSPPSRLTWALAEVPQVVDAEHRGDDPVKAYRAQLRSDYAEWAAKGRPARWTNADPPRWLRYLVRVDAAA